MSGCQGPFVACTPVTIGDFSTVSDPKNANSQVQLDSKKAHRYNIMERAADISKRQTWVSFTIHSTKWLSKTYLNLDFRNDDHLEYILGVFRLICVHFKFAY